MSTTTWGIACDLEGDGQKHGASEKKNGSPVIEFFFRLFSRFLREFPALLYQITCYTLGASQTSNTSLSKNAIRSQEHSSLGTFLAALFAWFFISLRLKVVTVNANRFKTYHSIKFGGQITTGCSKLQEKSIRTWKWNQPLLGQPRIQFTTLMP